MRKGILEFRVESKSKVERVARVRQGVNNESAIAAQSQGSSCPTYQWYHLPPPPIQSRTAGQDI